MDRDQPDDGAPAPDRKGLNQELKDRKQREEHREQRAHQNRTGSFLEDGLPVREWMTLKVRKPMTMTAVEAWSSGPRRRPTHRSAKRWAPWTDRLWWDDAFRRWINEVQRLVGFTVGFIRADEALPDRHIHVAIIAHRPVPVRVLQQAWLTITGSTSTDAVWVETYRPRGGGLSYQMKADDNYGCGWQLSPNIDLFRLSGDGKIHCPSTSRERRYARRILAPRVAGTTPKIPSSGTERGLQPRVQPQSPGGGSRPRVQVGCLQGRQQTAIRLVDPRSGGRLVTSCPQLEAA